MGLVIMDHGLPGGNVQFGDRAITEEQIKQMCHVLCDDAAIVLVSCNIGENGGMTPDRMMKICGHKIRIIFASHYLCSMQSTGQIDRWTPEFPTGDPRGPFDGGPWDDWGDLLGRL